jgi:hypothetical protein
MRCAVMAHARLWLAPEGLSLLHGRSSPRGLAPHRL